MSVLGAGPVAVRPSALVDRQATVAVARMKRSVLGRLALPVDDVSRRQIGPPPRTSPRPFCYRSLTTGPLGTRIVITALHPVADCVSALLGCAAHSRLRLESVARTGHRLDVARRTPLIIELHAELADMAVNDVALDLE